MLSGSWVEKYEKKFFLTKMYKKLLLTNDVALLLMLGLQWGHGYCRQCSRKMTMLCRNSTIGNDEEGSNAGVSFTN